MAQSNYTKYRSKVLAEIRKQKKLGLEIELDLPLTERQLRQQGITGQRLRHETLKLKKQIPELRNVSRETLRQQKEEKQYYENLFETNRQQLQERINRRNTSQYQQAIQEPRQPLARTPDGDFQPITPEETPEGDAIRFENKVDDLLALLKDRPTAPIYDRTAKRLSYDLRPAYYDTILAEIEALISEVGKAELGRRLQANLPSQKDTVDTIYMDSNQAEVYNAYMVIISALNNGSVSNTIAKAVSDLSEEQSGFADV